MPKAVDPKIVLEIIRRVPGWVYLPVAIGAGISLVIVAQQWAAWKFERRLQEQRTADRVEQQAQRERDKETTATALDKAVETVMARADMLTSNKMATAEANIKAWVIKKAGEK